MRPVDAISIGHTRAQAGADDGIRTRDLRFTKPLLYQLSYVGAEREITSSAARDKRRENAAGCTAVALSRRLIEVRGHGGGAPWLQWQHERLADLAQRDP